MLADKPTFYVHIGPHKTGSTTIQKNLSANREALRHCGYVYPDAGMIFDGQHNIVSEINALPAYRSALGGLKELAQELSATKSNVIISSETFDTVEVTEPLQKLRDAFAQHFQFKIIPYLRSQDSLLASTWKMQIRRRLTRLSFGDWLQQGPEPVRYADYCWWLSLYEAVFGRENICPQIYHSNNSNHFREFLLRCDIDSVNGFKWRDDHNPSWSNLHCVLLQRLVYEQGYEFKRTSLAVHDYLTAHPEHELCDLYNERQYQAVKARYFEVNAAVADAYFSRTRLFQSDFDRPGARALQFEPLNEPRLIEMMAQIQHALD